MFVWQHVFAFFPRVLGGRAFQNPNHDTSDEHDVLPSTPIFEGRWFTIGRMMNIYIYIIYCMNVDEFFRIFHACWTVLLGAFPKQICTDVYMYIISTCTLPETNRAPKNQFPGRWTFLLGTKGLFSTFVTSFFDYSFIMGCIILVTPLFRCLKKLGATTGGLLTTGLPRGKIGTFYWWNIWRWSHLICILWKSKTLRIIVPNFGWLRFPTIKKALVKTYFF